MIGSHTVGNALVLHARDKISSQARELSLAVPADAEHDIVVLDLHDELPMGVWDEVATALPRRGRPIRLAVCGTDPDVAALVGQWLSDRLGRPVVAPHGHLIRGSAGALFVHGGQESGWVRHHPGREPAWDGKRYPRPAWDGAALEYRPTSANGVAEPLPGGVWIRDARDPAAVARHWQRLTSTMPVMHRDMTVVLGCPGTPELSLDDVARFWYDLRGSDRDRTRFVHYGPVQTPAGMQLGQALAEILSSPVVLFAGVPVGRPERPRMHTIAPDGALGWQPYAREIAFRPRMLRDGPPELPHIFSYRAPKVFGEEIAPRVYRYTDDAVVETLQSGLWVRPEAEPGYADRIRARAADPVHHAVVVDDATPALVPRLRELADDLVARLDETTRKHSALQLASTVGFALHAELEALTGPTLAVPTLSRRGAAAPGKAGGNLTTSVPPAPEQADQQTASSVAEPVVADPTAPPTAAPFAAESLVAESLVAPPVEHSVWAPAPEVAEPTSWAREAGPPVVGPVPGPEMAGSEVGAPAYERLSMPVSRISEALRPGQAPLPPETVTPPAAVAPALEVPAPEMPAFAMPGAEQAEPYPYAFPVPVEQAAGAHRVPEAAPEADALGEEHAWLRTTLAAEFAELAGPVGAVLAANPRLNLGHDALADAVAVRLYLSPRADDIDAALRSGRPGPHEPFARCVAAGLRRLPLHRGLVLLRATLTAEEVRALAARQVLTDVGFINGLTEPAEGLPGTVDVLVWSVAGRRTQLLEAPDGSGVPTRVVFPPGTGFKVLESGEPDPDGAPGWLLLRELPSHESGLGPSPYEHLVATSLRRSAEEWAERGPTAPLAVANPDRFTVVPGQSRL